MDWFESILISLFTTVSLCFGESWARDYCGKLRGKEYFCNEGHCCGDFDCCTYFKYYEAWWFWLVWGLITVLACCCAYHRRKYYSHHGQIRNFVYPTTLRRSPEGSNTYAEAMIDPKYYKLPSYAEVEAMGSLDPPADGEGAPPPYVDPQANEELPVENGATNSQNNEALLDSTEDLRSSPVITCAPVVQSSENP